MRPDSVDRDERTEQVENVSVRWAYIFLTFAIFADAMYRGYVLHQSTWDLLGLVMGASVVMLAYQATHRVLTRGLTRYLVWVAAGSAVVSALLAWGWVAFRRG